MAQLLAVLRPPALAALVAAQPTPDRPTRFLVVLVALVLPTVVAGAELVAPAVVRPSQPLAALVPQVASVLAAVGVALTVVAQVPLEQAARLVVQAVAQVVTAAQLVRRPLVPLAQNGMPAVVQVAAAAASQSVLLVRAAPMAVEAEEPLVAQSAPGQLAFLLSHGPRSLLLPPPSTTLAQAL